ncbi:MAG: hypothetical protein J0L76_08495 [Rhodobacterales bacterium]|nr:hypothetical protein [Rhodobacterales bacterium]
MTRFAYALAATLALAAPVAADSLNILLPTLTFPTETVTSSTKGCDAPAAICQPAE